MVTAQDPQFSQFYAAPLYLNPAFAGNTQQTRAGLNYRSQWPAIDANFVTTAVYLDHFIDDKNSGIGLLIMRDQEGLAGLQSTSVALQYAYQLYLTDKITFRPGFQAAFFHRNVNFDRLTFGDQFDPATGNLINPATAEMFDTGLSRSFLSLAAGGVFYSSNAWLGFSAHHMNTPNQSIIDEDNALPLKLSLHGGYRFMLKPGVIGTGLYAQQSERSISPTFQYKTQGPFDQLDMGLYFTFEPIVFGTWYRGLPFKDFEGFNNNESIVMLLGFTRKIPKGKSGVEILNIGYSYDITISKLGPGSGGAHEFSISYAWPTGDPRKPSKNVMQIPCPDF